MEQVILNQGSEFRIRPAADMVQMPALPAGNYTIRFDQKAGEFYLVKAEEFVRPAKMYGDVAGMASHLLKSYELRGRTTGVLLDGDKGSGKSLQAKETCIQAVEAGMPVLLVSAPFAGELFHTFLASIKQPAVVFIDEAEKVYATNTDEDGDPVSGSRGNAQESLLTMLDGGIEVNKLVLMTCNDIFKMDTHIRNRPGRAFYRLKYGGLSTTFVRQYLAENLKNPEHVQDAIKVLMAYNPISFDAISALVWEMNAFSKDAKSAVSILNLDARYSVDARWVFKFTTPEGKPLLKVEETPKDEEVDPETGSRYTLSEASDFKRCNPINDGFVLQHRMRKCSDDVGAPKVLTFHELHEDGNFSMDKYSWLHQMIDRRDCVLFEPSMITSISEDGDVITFTNPNGWVMKAERQTYSGYSTL